MVEDIGIQTVSRDLQTYENFLDNTHYIMLSRIVIFLRCLKSYLHSTMGQKRFTAVTLLDIKKDIMPDIDKIIDTFAKHSPWKLQLCYS